MTLVAITKWARPPAEELTALAELFPTMALPDLRVLLAGPLPLVCGQMESQRANHMVSALRSRRHGAIAYELGDLPNHEELHSPRTYSFEKQEFVTESGNESVRTAYSDITALMRLRIEESSERKTVTTSKKFSMSGALTTGGLKMRKTVTKEGREQEVVTGQLLYVVAERGWLRMGENRLRHQGLGQRIAPTAIQNFKTLVKMIREVAPHALFDDRLLKQKRRPSAIVTSAVERSSSNEFENYLAANLILRAHSEHQL